MELVALNINNTATKSLKISKG